MLDLIKGAANRVATSLFGTKADRDRKKLAPLVDEILAVEPSVSSLSDEELQAKTVEFRRRLAEGAALDDLHAEAFAVVKEACRRHVGQSWNVVGMPQKWEMVPFDVQLMGGTVLHQGKIAEMATGEGKTLVAIFPLYLNALEGQGAHLITVNDYLARRDSEWVGQILQWLGLSVGCIQHDMDNASRRDAYRCDVTYGTNNEFGFDYLRDNMVVRPEERVQRKHHFAIVDEVDSVLIDEARTPLIISGPVAHTNQQYDRLRGPVEELVRRQATLMSRFLDEAEKMLESTDKDELYQAAYRLLQVQRGAPRHKRLAKITSEGEWKKRIRSVENDYMRDKKLHEIDEQLLYAIDERGHSVNLSSEGRDILSPGDPHMFTLPDLSEEMGAVDKQTELPVADRIREKEEIHRKYAMKSELLGNVNQLLRAFALYEKDREYVVQDGKVLIVDEFTGRLMPGRRFSDGLHQALEAKERVRVGEENQTLATITVQNYFRLYDKLGGMTGTAETEAAEFFDIYKLDVVVIPSNEPINRIDNEDLIYRTRKEKYDAILDEIERTHKEQLPVLVGTVSVDVSETLSRMLKRRGINHHVLNAKYHQQEAEIISRAGQPGAVTIATNMAGRGTDIKLGVGVVRDANNAPVDPDRAKSLGKGDLQGGLYIIGTERHEARRIDRQLRGRAGRQGDPGSSVFFLSVEDDLMRLFVSDRIAAVMDKLGVQEGEVITHPWMTKAIGTAQKRVEMHNFSIRKHLLDYDNVMNQQREVIYGLRNELLDEESVQSRIEELIRNHMEKVLEPYRDPKARIDEWERLLTEDVQGLVLSPVDLEQAFLGSFEQVEEAVRTAITDAYVRKEALFGPERMREVERRIFLAVIDEKWRDHLHEIDQLRSGISLRAYGQRDPLLEYKGEAFRMFEELMGELEADTVKFLFRVVPAPTGPVGPGSGGPPPNPLPPPRLTTRPQPVAEVTSVGGAETMSNGGNAATPEPQIIGAPLPRAGAPPGQKQQASKAASSPYSGAPAPSNPLQRGGAPTAGRPVVKTEEKIGRNEPCPCGSGKKYKKCCGADEA